MNLEYKKDTFNYKIFSWLIILTIMVLGIIIVGGLTRLTESGLSMVDWKPILGILPPLSQEAWFEAFDKYKLTPEYIYINSKMTLNEFQYIFWWEWGHRILARLIGIVFIFPLIFFIFTKQLKFFLINRLILVFIFGIFQALVGWWMVKSGLSEDPYVSAYRLTFHLINALIIYSILFWTSMDYFYIDTKKNNLKIQMYDILLITSIILLFLTIISGGFMAGTHSGQSFNTFPLMDGKIIPADYYFEEYGYLNIFENNVAINFNHRWLATFTFIYIFSLFFYFIISKKKFISLFIIYVVIFFLIFQFLLGILTLISNVNISYASLHQTNSVLLLSSILLAYHQYIIQKINSIK